MKTSILARPKRAMTRIDVIVVVGVFGLLGLLLLLALASAHQPRSRIGCISNLKQVGIAYRVWEGDNHDKYPMAVSVTNGGVRELVSTGNVVACFQTMSNELSTPWILLCPAHARHVWATNFSSLKSSNISYFVGVDVPDESNPDLFLSGDDNFALSGLPVKPAVLELLTNSPVAWTKERHKFIGNLGMADGSAQQLTIHGFQNALLQTGVATNRLAIP